MGGVPDLSQEHDQCLGVCLAWALCAQGPASLVGQEEIGTQREWLLGGTLGSCGAYPIACLGLATRQAQEPLLMLQLLCKLLSPTLLVVSLRALYVSQACLKCLEVVCSHCWPASHPSRPLKNCI